MRAPGPERWMRGKLERITTMPRSTLFEEGEAETEEIKSVPAPGERKGEKKARQFYVMPHLLAEFGYTVDCPQCARISVYGKGKTGISHIAKCRERI